MGWERLVRVVGVRMEELVGLRVGGDGGGADWHGTSGDFGCVSVGEWSERRS